MRFLRILEDSWSILRNPEGCLGFLGVFQRIFEGFWRFLKISVSSLKIFSIFVGFLRISEDSLRFFRDSLDYLGFLGDFLGIIWGFLKDFDDLRRFVESFVSCWMIFSIFLSDSQGFLEILWDFFRDPECCLGFFGHFRGIFGAFSKNYYRFVLINNNYFWLSANQILQVELF